MKSEIPWRTRLLASTCGAVLTAAAYSVSSSTAGYRPLAPFSFPESMPLAGWEPRGSELLHERQTNLIRASNVVQAGRVYQYVRDGIPLDVEVRYVTRTAGAIGRLLAAQTSLPIEAYERGEIRRDEGIGFSIQFAHGGRAHLDACIHSRGATTATQAQFVAAHRPQDLDRRGATQWLLGRESLREPRCLWVNLSTPADDEELPAAYRRLQAAWKECHLAWQPRFPNH